MSHLWNPLATARQLEESDSNNAMSRELQDSIRYSTAQLTQAAGILLRLPQSIAAQAVVILMRFWTVEPLIQHEFSDVSAASIYLTAKISSSPRSLRSITNVYAYLLSPTSVQPRPESYYVSESTYLTTRTRLLVIEGQILNATAFTMHVALPHPLAITYLQTLDVFGASDAGPRVARRALQYLNTALLGPQMLYLTHQPTALATAAVYLAARDEEVKLPGVEWWEVFDTDREELGFLALGMRSLEGWVRGERERWEGKGKGMGGGVITRRAVGEEMRRRGDVGGDQKSNGGAEDEEAEMMRMMDERMT